MKIVKIKPRENFPLYGKSDRKQQSEKNDNSEMNNSKKEETLGTGMRAGSNNNREQKVYFPMKVNTESTNTVKEVSNQEVTTAAGATDSGSNNSSERHRFRK